MTLTELISGISTLMGGNEVTSLPSTQKIPEAALDNYHKIARSLIARYPFPEAIKYTQLTYDPGVPTNHTSFYYRYEVPPDLKSPLEINNDEKADFRYEGGVIYTDYEEPTLRYISDITLVYESDGTTIDYTADLLLEDETARAIQWAVIYEIAPGNVPKLASFAERRAAITYTDAIASAGQRAREKYDGPELVTDQ